MRLTILPGPGSVPLVTRRFTPSVPSVPSLKLAKKINTAVILNEVKDPQLLFCDLRHELPRLHGLDPKPQNRGDNPSIQPRGNVVEDDAPALR